jgi:hypothetical protein
MKYILDSRAQHRELEEVLDCLQAGWLEDDFLEAERLALAHYVAEESGLFAELREVHSPMVLKMTAQHDESRELARAIRDCQPSDRMYLYRRFWAITQHNIIEEERDLFPLAANHQARAER